MTTTTLPLSAGLIIISYLSCIFLSADLSACAKLSVLGTYTSTLCLVSDLIRLMTDSSLVFLLGFVSEGKGKQRIEIQTWLSIFPVNP